MTTQAAGSTSGGDLPDRPPGGWVPPRPAWQQAVVSVFGFVGGRLRTLGGALVLAIGAVLLINAWQTGPARWRESGALRSMTGRGVATLERAWWRLDFDPRPLGQDGTNWEDLSTPELCARIRVERAGTAATSAVYCRQWQKLSRGSLLTSDAELAPGVPVSWAGPDGKPAIDLRFSERAFRWLSQRSPSFWFVARPGLADRARRLARSELDVLWVLIDDPLGLLAREWSLARDWTFSVAFDPARPTRVLPESVLQEAMRPDITTTVVPAMLGIGGLAFWIVGWYLFLESRWKGLPAIVAVATALAVPWWGDLVPRALGSVWEPAGGFVDFFAREMVHRPPVAIVREPDYGGELGDIQRPWTFETSFYAAELSGLRLERPGQAGDAASVRAGLAAEVRSQLGETTKETEELLRGVE